MRNSNDILYIGATHDQTGLGTAAREHCRALSQAGMDFSIWPRAFTSEPIATPELKKHMVTRPPEQSKVCIYHLLPKYIGDIFNQVAADYRIAYVAWETDRLPDEDFQVLSNMHEFWVPCDQNKEVLEKTFPGRPVFKFPHPVNHFPLDGHEFKMSSVGPDTFMYLHVSHLQGRKNLSALLRAFWSAFTKEDDVVLVLKLGMAVKRADVVLEVRRLKAESKLTDLPETMIISQHLEAHELDILFNRADAYVSLSHAEAFGLEAARAMALGKPSILSAVPGHLEYANEDNALIVPTFKTPVYDPYPSFNARMNWWDVDMGAAINAFRICREENQEKRCDLARKTMEYYNYERIGGMMKERLEEVLLLPAQDIKPMSFIKVTAV